MALANMHSLPQETTDRKAGCGKSARPVWREGWSSNLHPYPIVLTARWGFTALPCISTETCRSYGAWRIMLGGNYRHVAPDGACAASRVPHLFCQFSPEKCLCHHAISNLIR